MLNFQTVRLIDHADLATVSIGISSFMANVVASTNAFRTLTDSNDTFSTGFYYSYTLGSTQYYDLVTSVDGSGGNDTLTAISPSGFNANGGFIVFEGGSYAYNGSSLYGRAGNDTLTGGDGNDYLAGGTDNDILNGGSGDDTLLDFEGVNVLDGGEGNDVITGNFSSTLRGGAGNDTLNVQIGGTSPTILDGGAGDDTLNTNGNLTTSTITGVEHLRIGGGTLTAAQLNSFIDVGASTGATSFSITLASAGSVGANFLTTASGNLFASAGDDTITLGSSTGTWSIRGGAGNDTITTGSGNDTLNDVEGVNVLNGGDGNDLITGNFSSTIRGGAGNDTLTLLNLQIGATSPSILDGGTGDDTLSASGDLSTSVISGVEHFRTAFATVTAEQLNAFVDVGPGNGPNLSLTLAGTGTTGTVGANFLASTSGTLAATADNDTIALDGSTGQWTVFGGAGNDQITTGSGNDFLYGCTGSDFLTGGAGADRLEGGENTDFARYADASTGLTISLLQSSINTGEAAGDTYISIEGLIGSRFDDSLTGDAGANILMGLDGNDQLIGGAGADVLDGGAGYDQVLYLTSTQGIIADMGSPATSNTGDAAGDSYVSIEGLGGSQFADLLIGGATSTLNGFGGDDNLVGGSLGDYLFGDDGNDNLYGGGSGDYLSGGAGFDAVRYDNATSGVTAVLINSGFNAGTDAAGDVYVGIEAVVGSAFGDVLIGDNGSNLIAGQDGNDFLDGYAGNDLLYGGTGADIFSFKAGSGQDVVGDFTAQGSVHDTILIGPNVNGSGIVDYASLQSHLSQSGADVLIDLGAGNSVLLQNVQLAQLTTSDFAFG